MARKLSRWSPVLLLLAASGSSTMVGQETTAQKGSTPDFAREVQPILARYCFKCHGPDEKTRKAKLRLDVPGDKNGPNTPGKPDESELIARIFSDDPKLRMPPPSTKMELSDEQKKTLRRWISAGAKYERHWSFVPPRAEGIPKVANASWARNEIDHFVLAELESRGLKPSPPADRYTLIRRVSLDLIGLPPTPAEADAFVKDKAPDAYETLVDRLLKSPHYGERWARRWLDLARYADTNGYEKDRTRVIWPYRDWVIKAINDDMPFDQFTIEQIAGDMLPGATPSQIVATGFHRNTMVNEEGGIDPLEFRYYAVVDRVNTTGTAWLGMTLGCAQCHSHKYDPISQREYYQMMALLNNADEPDYEIPDADTAKQRAAIDGQIGTKVAELPNRFPGGRAAAEKAFAAWVQRDSSNAVAWTVIRPNKWKANEAFHEVQKDGAILVGGDQTKSDTYELDFTVGLKGVTALRLEVLPHESLPDRGPGRTYYEGRKGDFFLSELSLSENGKPVAFSNASHDYAKGAFGAAKVGAQFCFDRDPSSGWSTTDRPGEAHEAVFNFSQPTDLVGKTSLHMLFERHYACGLGCFRLSVTSDAKKAQATAHGLAIEKILAKPADQRTAEEKQQLLRRFLEVTPELASARKEIEQLRASMPAYKVTMVMKERPDAFPRLTRLHHRGEFLQAKESVKPESPSFLPPMPKDAKKSRLDLARWLVSPENPLTARVLMNRQWQAFFGRGIVRTMEDFGLQGELPTHPQLLDWLARELVRQKWSMKAMHKQIVMSSTYQQSALVTPELLKVDPENKLLARGPRVRLEAELIRDSLLRVSGLLSSKIGGPSVFPPQPPSVTSEGVYGAIKWTPSTGEDRYRRGMYTFLKRSIPYAMFATFDGVTGETCQPRREVSNSPLQALTMLNDLVVLESAQALGRAIAEAPGSDEERLVLLFRRCLTRPPTTKEQDTLLSYYRQQRERLESGKLDAKTIAGKAGGDTMHRAAWTLTARVVLNLDEMITKE